MARQRYRTQFCFIAPASLLDRYASHSKTHLVLPQITNPMYREFYARKRREGDLIILDNGAYELHNSVHGSDLCSAIEFYRPQVCALPDYLLQDGEITFEASRGFLYEVKERFPNTKWMYIPQSTPGDLQGWYKWLNIGLKELKPDWIGIPRALATDIATGGNAWLERANAVEQLTMRGVKTHALGMVNGDLKELELLFWEGCCSIDNSSPIWRGVLGCKLDNASHTEWWKDYGSPVDFNWNGVKDGKALSFNDSDVKHNMNLVLQILNQPRIV